MNERYRLVRSLATGGMAELFLGVARGAGGIERAVAIKRMLPHLADDPELARMFLAEARLALTLQHQNIASVYDVGQDARGLFLVMELVEGWDLGVLVRASRRERRFPPHLAAFITHQALSGLIHAYRKTRDGQPLMTAHRDISPSNVLVSREGEVKVTDFGIARMTGSSLSEPGTFKGKMDYSAPETLSGAAATSTSDQYSLGLVFYELLTGRHPFGELTEPLAVAQAILHRDIAPPRDVPPELAALVMRMLARAPGARFETPEALAESLARWLSRTGEPATSHALAAFLKGLKLPPTLRERGESAADVASVPQPPRAPAAVDPSAFLPENEWEPPPGERGAALSMSGRIVHRCVRCGAPLSAPRAPCDACASELAPPSPAFASTVIATPDAPSTPRTAVVFTTPPTPVPRMAMGSARPDAPAPSPVMSVAESMASPSRTASVLDLPGDALELAERAPRPESDWDPTAGGASRRWMRAARNLALLIILVGAGMLAWPQVSYQVRRVLAAGASPVVHIRSVPAGATVVVDDKTLGETPLVLDNLYPDQPIPVQLRLKGYKPWKGTFPGGEAARLDARLEH